MKAGFGGLDEVSLPKEVSRAGSWQGLDGIPEVCQ